MKQAEVALKQALTEVKRTSGDAVLQDIKVRPNISLTVQSQSILTPSYALSTGLARRPRFQPEASYPG